MHFSKKEKKHIEKVVGLYNKQVVVSNLPIFKKVEHIKRYLGFPGVALKDEAIKKLNFTEELFIKIFVLEDKICAIKYHLKNLERLTKEHEGAMSGFVRLLGFNTHIVHSAGKIRYEFEAYQFQFKSALDLLAHIVYLLYGVNRLDSPLRNLYGDRDKPYFKNQYLTTEIFKLFDNNSWINNFLSPCGAGVKSQRDQAAHYPWLLKYDYAEAKYENGELVYKAIKEEGGKKLFNYCSEYFNNISNLVSSVLDLVFQIKGN